MLSLVDDLKQLNGMVERLSGGSCAYPPDELASKAAEFLCIHYLNLTRIIESEATLSAEYEVLVIRLGEVTEKLEAARVALRRIADWELPPTGKTWPESGTPMSYEACNGSNGARSYMRGVAHAAMHDSAREGE